jgi:SAM-dependent methyltransferase
MLYDHLMRKVYNFEDYIFEKRLRIELSGSVSAANLITTHESKSHAFEYRPVYTRNLRELLSEALKTGYYFENFIDIGSGKGKACFYAYKKKMFNQIIGVEFSESLIQISDKNKIKLNAMNINFINYDAALYALPEQNNLVFMFNPFDAIILDKFISINIDHFKNKNTVIAYANDINRQILIKYGFETIFRNQIRQISLHQLK